MSDLENAPGVSASHAHLAPTREDNASEVGWPVCLVDRRPLARRGSCERSSDRTRVGPPIRRHRAQWTAIEPNASFTGRGQSHERKHRRLDATPYARGAVGRSTRAYTDSQAIKGRPSQGTEHAAQQLAAATPSAHVACHQGAMDDRGLGHRGPRSAAQSRLQSNARVLRNLVVGSSAADLRSYPAATFVSLKNVAGIGRSSSQMICIGFSDSCDT